ncbi:MAG: helix-turn-helix domain containing protein [Candidatus Nomurabacteria bacterium]|nr:helix-turn-helix domain containing protein [Candidatus Nomurabacteria bacterium]
MRHDQPKAFELRKQGKTYREIQRLLGISRSTLCDWFKNEEWSKHIKKSNIERHIKISTEHLSKMNEGRRIMLEKKYKKVEEDAEKEFEIYKNDPLFMAGLMLYAGEGDKLDKGIIRLANIDFNLHKVFLRFCKKFLKKERNTIKISLLLYPDLNINTCIQKWSLELSIPEKNFYKTQVIQGKLKTRKLHFGVGTTIILDSFLKRKLLFWIEKANIYLS